MDPPSQPLQEFIDQLFASKPAEKRLAWLKVFLAEEYETVSDLRSASEEAWNTLVLPLAIKDQIRAALKAPANNKVVNQPKPVDTRLIKQLDAIVFDISSSMNSRSSDPLNTRLGLAKTLFHTMVDKYIGLELSHSLSLVLFGQNTKCFPFVRDYETFHDTMGNAAANENATKLWDSIYEAAVKLIEYRKENPSLLETDCKCRIFCLTDGEDNASSRPEWTVCSFLQEHNIVLDSIPVATQNLKLQAMALATGGLCLRVTDAERGVELFEREAVISLAARETPKDPLPQVKSAADLNNLNVKAEATVLESVDDIKAAVPQAVHAKVMSADSVLQISNTTGSAATKRLLKEFKDGAPSRCHYFVTESDLFTWKIILEGEPNTPYAGGNFLIFLKFPTDYPFKPPSLTFITKIYHCNVNNDGKVCLDILRDQWSPALTVAKVMESIHALLVEPNAKDALDAVKANVYSDDKAKYLKFAEEWTRQYASETIEQIKQRYNFDGNATTNAPASSTQ